MLKGKKCGYVKYASKESAQQAIETLNEQTLCGSFLKVMIAEDSYAEKNKRARVDSEEVWRTCFDRLTATPGDSDQLYNCTQLST